MVLLVPLVALIIYIEKVMAYVINVIFSATTDKIIKLLNNCYIKYVILQNNQPLFVQIPRRHMVL